MAPEARLTQAKETRMEQAPKEGFSTFSFSKALDLAIIFSKPFAGITFG